MLIPNRVSAQGCDIDSLSSRLIHNQILKSLTNEPGNYNKIRFPGCNKIQISIDDKNKGLLYTESRIGSNAGDANFSWIFEGTEVRNEDWVTSRVL